MSRSSHRTSSACWPSRLTLQSSRSLAKIAPPMVRARSSNISGGSAPMSSSQSFVIATSAGVRTSSSASMPARATTSPSSRVTTTGPRRASCKSRLIFWTRTRTSRSVSMRSNTVMRTAHSRHGSTGVVAPATHWMTCWLATSFQPVRCCSATISSMNFPHGSRTCRPVTGRCRCSMPSTATSAISTR